MATVMREASAAELQTLLDRVTPMLVAYVAQHFEHDRPVCEAAEPLELERLLGLKWPDEGQGIDGVVKTVADALRYSVRTGHPRFLDKLYAGADPVGMIAELITAALNTNLHIYSVAPVFTLMELRTTQQLGEIFGYGRSSDGVSCPGGSYSNMLALVTARSSRFPSSKKTGQGALPRLVVFTSADAHYSVSKNAILAGIGLDNVIQVPTTPDGRMIVEELEKAIVDAEATGAVPLFVNATAGTTVVGAFDDFGSIARVARNHSCWMHVDACWGGAVAFSEPYKHLLDNVHLADSIAWNAHKMMGVPIQSSVLLVKETGLLQRCNAFGAGYLFHDETEFDLGDKTMQCGRRPDILKLYLAWQYHGRQGFARRVELAYSNTAIFLELLRGAPTIFRLVMHPVYVNVCFWFWPDQIDDELPSMEERYRCVSTLTAAIHTRMVQRGRVLMDFSPNAHGPSFFRIIIQSPHVSRDDLQFALDEITSVGKEQLPVVLRSMHTS